MYYDASPPTAATYMPSMSDLYQREHRYDRELAAAVYQRFRTASGLGYQFEVPATLRAAP